MYNVLGVTGGARVIVGNATVVAPDDTQPGVITLYAGDEPRPNASTLNYVPGQVVANHFTVRLENDTAFVIHATTTTDIVIDVIGFYAVNGTLISPGNAATLTAIARTGDATATAISNSYNATSTAIYRDYYATSTAIAAMNTAGNSATQTAITSIGLTTTPIPGSGGRMSGTVTPTLGSPQTAVAATQTAGAATATAQIQTVAAQTATAMAIVPTPNINAILTATAVQSTATAAAQATANQSATLTASAQGGVPSVAPPARR